MPSTPRQQRELPAREWDSPLEFSARTGLSLRTIWRKIEGGMAGVIRIVEPGNERGVIRIDPPVAMADLRGELPPKLPTPPRRGRPRKRDEGATASPTEAAAVARRPKLRLRHRTPGSL
jgi:hypothetical protein